MRGEQLDRDDLPLGIKRDLDASADSLSPEIIGRLHAARLRAVEAAEKRPGRFIRFPVWLTAGGVATVAVILIAVTLWLPKTNGNLSGPPDDDIDEIAATESIDFLEDLDFYLWLAEQNNAR